MPNLTLTIDAELLRAAKIYAARSGTSVSRIVRAHLAELTGLEARPAGSDAVARFARGEMGRHEAMRALGVDYGGLLDRLAERDLALPRVADEQAAAMAQTFAEVWRTAAEE